MKTTLKIGDRLNRWTIIGESIYKACLKCKCDCGVEKDVNIRALETQKSKSCGCLQKETTKIRLEQNRLKEGQKFNMLTIIRAVYNKKRNDFNYLCLCECGNTTKQRGYVLKNGTVKSCGCYAAEQTGLRSKNKVVIYKDFKKRSELNIFRKYERRAKIDGIEFNLNFDLFCELINSKCYYCNSSGKNKIKVSGTTNYFWYNGIDRVNNLVGYKQDNCVPCCKDCNNKKHSITPSIVEKVYKFIFEKK